MHELELGANVPGILVIVIPSVVALAILSALVVWLRERRR